MTMQSQLDQMRRAAEADRSQEALDRIKRNADRQFAIQSAPGRQEGRREAEGDKGPGLSTLIPIFIGAALAIWAISIVFGAQ
jgi:hypothetical protein